MTSKQHTGTREDRTRYAKLTVGFACLAACGLFVSCGPPGEEAGGTGAAEEEEDAVVLEPPAAPTSWVLFRGDSEMRGVSEEEFVLPLQLRWSFDTEDPILATAVLEAGRVYVGSDSGIFYCIDLVTGEEQWRHATEFGIEGTACILDDKVVYGAKDGIVYALEKESGAEVWRYETDDQILGGVNAYAMPGESGEVRLVACSYDYNLHCINAADGSRVWIYPTENFVNGTPTISDGRAIIGGCDGFLRMISLETGEEISAIPIDAYISNSVAVRDDIGYVAHYGNKVEAYDLGTSEKVWEFEDRSFEYYASPAVTEDRVYAAGRDKRVHCLDRMTGERLWEFVARGKIDSSPVCPNAIFFGSDDGRVYAIDPGDGAELWAYETGGEVSSSPAMGEGALVICGEDGVVYCFESGEGPAPEEASSTESSP